MRSLGDYLRRLHEQLDSKESFAHIPNCVQLSLIYLTPEASLHPLLKCLSRSTGIPGGALLTFGEG